MKENYSVPMISDFNAAEKSKGIFASVIASILTTPPPGLQVSTGRPLMKVPPYLPKKDGLNLKRR